MEGVGDERTADNRSLGPGPGPGAGCRYRNRRRSAARSGIGGGGGGVTNGRERGVGSGRRIRTPRGRRTGSGSSPSARRRTDHRGTATGHTRPGVFFPRHLRPPAGMAWAESSSPPARRSRGRTRRRGRRRRGRRFGRSARRATPSGATRAGPGGPFAGPRRRFDSARPTLPRSSTRTERPIPRLGRSSGARSVSRRGRRRGVVRERERERRRRPRRRGPTGGRPASSSSRRLSRLALHGRPRARRIERLGERASRLPDARGRDGVDREDERVTPPRGAPRSTRPHAPRFATLEAEFQPPDSALASGSGARAWGWRRRRRWGGPSPLGDEPGARRGRDGPPSSSAGVALPDDAVKALEDVRRDAPGSFATSRRPAPVRAALGGAGDPAAGGIRIRRIRRRIRIRVGAQLRDPLALTRRALASAAAKRRAATDAALRAVRADAEEVRAAARRARSGSRCANAARVSRVSFRETSDASRACGGNAAAEARRERPRTTRAVRGGGGGGGRGVHHAKGPGGCR